MRPFRFASALVIGALGSPMSGLAQDAPKSKAAGTATAATAPSSKDSFDTREALDKYYDRQFNELIRRRIKDLTGLAAKQQGDEAESTYRNLFRLALGREEYEAAEKAAEAYIARKDGKPDLLATANFVNLIAKTSRNRDDQALRDLATYLRKDRPAASDDAKDVKRIDPNTLYAIGESFLQRLVRQGRHDTARKACALFVSEDQNAAVKAHFRARQAMLELLDQAAPAIDAADIDGQRFRLADLKGKVVLIDFWATWCPPCIAAIPEHQALYEKYRERGFEIVGVNLDGAHGRDKDQAALTSHVRRSLIALRIPWPNILNSKGREDIAKAYSVSDLPASFLVDRDGKITHIELVGSELEKAVKKAIGDAKEPKAKTTTDSEAKTKADAR